MFDSRSYLQDMCSGIAMEKNWFFSSDHCWTRQFLMPFLCKSSLQDSRIYCEWFHLLTSQRWFNILLMQLFEKWFVLLLDQGTLNNTISLSYNFYFLSQIAMQSRNESFFFFFCFCWIFVPLFLFCCLSQKNVHDTIHVQGSSFH